MCYILSAKIHRSFLKNKYLIENLQKDVVSFDFQWIISIIALLNARKRMMSKDNAYDTIVEYGRSCRKRQMKLSEKIV